MSVPGPSEGVELAQQSAMAEGPPAVSAADSPIIQQPNNPNTLHSPKDSGDGFFSGSESDGSVKERGQSPVQNTSGKVDGGKRRRRKKKHKKINREHPEFELTYDMMLGIRTTVSQTEAKPVRELHHNDFVDTIKHNFRSEGTNATPAHQMRDFKFKDYAPEVFRRLRQRFGITASEYLLSVCGNFQYLEFISNSKSGQFFFYTHNRQFMIKTVSKDESKFLRRILPHYYHHVMSNPNTLLTRFYGMHRVKPHKKPQVHFLIFASVFYNSKYIHVTYDLKGSSLNRSATDKDKEEASSCVYKDNDFLEKKVKIKVGPARSKLLNEQISQDVEFLRQLNIMDYSLLLGVHYGDRPVHKGRNRSVSEGAGATSGDYEDDVEDSELETGGAVKSGRRSKRPSFVVAKPPISQLNATGTESATATVSVASAAPSVTDPSPNVVPAAVQPEDVHASEDPAVIAQETDTVGPLVSVMPPPADEKAPPTGPEAEVQTHYGLPPEYTKRSKPEDIQFVAPEFAPVLVPERKEVANHNAPGIKVVHSVFTQDDGGIQATDANGNPLQEWYYFGIIDILTLYGMRKRVEHFGLSLKYKSDTMSAVNPKMYGKRFKQFIATSLE